MNRDGESCMTMRADPRLLRLIVGVWRFDGGGSRKNLKKIVNVV